MSTAFAATTKALGDNPELFNKVISAGSAEERAALLRGAGLYVPTHADVNAHLGNMAGVAGGSGTGATTQGAEDGAEALAGAGMFYATAPAAASAGAAAA